MNEGDICVTCNGSGEGQHDGSTCWHCKGSGVSLDTSQDDQEATNET